MSSLSLIEQNINDRQNEQIILNFQAAKRTCILLNSDPFLLFEIDGKYRVYRSRPLDGDWEVRSMQSNETLGTFHSKMLYYVTKKTLQFIRADEAKQTPQAQS